jgi:PGF-pre-PGF domain-containing protein
MKNMKNLFVSLILIVTLFCTNSVNVAEAIYGGNDIHTEYLKDNATFGTSDMCINITVDTLGKLVYVEEYFSADSEGNPVPVMSRTYFDRNITNDTLSVVIQRPFGQGHYSMIRGVLVLDGKRVYEEWLKSVAGDHLTYTDYKGFNIGTKVEKSEMRELLVGNESTRYSFATPDLGIYGIDVIGFGNKNSALIRIELLKNVPDGSKMFPGTVYKYLNVAVESRQIEDMNIKFKVENSWMADNNVAKNNIELASWKGKWYSLNTSIISEDENYTYYNAEYNAENNPGNITGTTGFVIASLRHYAEKNNVDIVQTHKVVVITSPAKVEKESLQKGIVERMIESFRRLLL